MLRVLEPKGLFCRQPAKSSIELRRCISGAVRYCEIFLKPGRDGLAVQLLREHTAPFMSPRLVAVGAAPEGISTVGVRDFVNAVLLQTALRCAVYMGGIVGVVEPSGDDRAAVKFLPYCGEVRLVTAKEAPPRGDGIVVCREIYDLKGCNIIVALSGLAGFPLPQYGDIKDAVIFTGMPDMFNGGLVIDSIKPRIPTTVMPLPEGVDALTYAAACYSLCGMYGLAALTPLQLLSRGKPVGFDKIFR